MKEHQILRAIKHINYLQGLNLLNNQEAENLLCLALNKYTEYVKGNKNDK